MIGSPLTRGSLLRLGIPAGLIFVCAVVLGWGAGDVIVPPQRPPAPPRWAMPQPRTEDPTRDFAAVMAGKPWNRSSLFGGASRTSPAPANLAATTWRLAGVAQRGGDSFALIAVAATPTAQIDYRRVGDRLPDSSVIVAVTPDSITTKGAKHPARTYRLFGAKD